MKVYNAMIDGMLQHAPGVIVEHPINRDHVDWRDYREVPGFKVHRLAASAVVGGLFTAYYTCDEVDCHDYGSKWFFVYFRGLEQASGLYEEEANLTMDANIKKFAPLGMVELDPVTGDPKD